VSAARERQKRENSPAGCDRNPPTRRSVCGACCATGVSTTSSSAANTRAASSSSVSPSPPSDGGEGRGEEEPFYWFPLSSVLSPLVPRGERMESLMQPRRQYPCGSYFLDFYCAQTNLAVELDGGRHGFPEQRTKDQERNRFLAARGIKVLRFWNHQLRKELASVRWEIWYSLMERAGRTAEIAALLPKPPHPSPQALSPRRGEGESRP